jgi:hypothetical protein
VQHDHPEPISAPYRFSVRTDREGNRMIEQLAKASGISSTAYVQRHFETIFPQVDAGVMPTIAPAEVSSAVDHDDDFDEAGESRTAKPRPGYSRNCDRRRQPTAQSGCRSGHWVQLAEPRRRRRGSICCA